MIDETLRFFVAASAVSFAWLLASGHRPAGERSGVGAVCLGAIVSISAVVYFLWRGHAPIALLLGLAYAGGSLLAWRVLPDWNTRGHGFLVAFAAALGAFLTRIAGAILFGRLAPLSYVFSLILFAAEVLVILITLYFAFEVLDVMCRIRWRRAFPPYRGPNRYWPKVSIHVPAHAEPPDMVIHTLAALRLLDYPDYEIILIDDNTRQDELWRPALDFCRRAGIKVFHLKNYPGFKSGALNFALTQTAPDAEIVCVVDSDYLVEPNFLRETVPYFQDPAVAFVQTPQAFSNSDENLFAHRSALAQRFFFEVSMRSRNERNAIIFCGTMGLIRKRVLERIGGWDEWCITEDAETSLRILAKGYASVYVARPYGRGLVPTTFQDTKKQRFRWAFGGMQILKRHWKRLLGIPAIPEDGRLGFRQQLPYLMGLLGWVNDLLVLIFAGFLLLTTAAFVLGWQLPIRQLIETILLVPVLSVVTGTLRVAWGLRKTTGCSWSDGLGAFASMLSLSWTVARACLSAIVNDKGTFLRTPKFGSEADLSRALRTAGWEASLGIALVAAIPLVLNARTNQEGVLLAFLLGWHAIVYLSALRSSLLEMVPAHGRGSGGRLRLPQPS